MARPSGIVALLTDYGLQDPYVGMMKGTLLSVNPAARIVDLTHEVPPQDIAEGGRILSSSRVYFPAGTVFVAVVDPGVGTDRGLVGVEADGQFFLAPDNGLLTFLRGSTRRIVRITQSKYFRSPVWATFHGRDILAPVAGHLTRGVDLGRFGPPASSLSVLPRALPHWTDERLEGEVVSIDRFGNLITNIPWTLLPASSGVRIAVGRKTLRKLSRTYADAPKGDLLALVGSTGFLEISVNQGSASKAARIQKGDRVLVTPARR